MEQLLVVYGYSYDNTTKGALEKLLMGANGIEDADAGKALGDALAANTVLKELDLSSPIGYRCDVGFIQTFSAGLGTNGAMKSLNLSENQVPADQLTSIETMCKSKGIAFEK